MPKGRKMANTKDNSKRASVEILKEAIEIQIKKGDDYNNPHSRISQSDYYVRGVSTILDIAYGKVLRMYSVLETMEAGGKVNFESIEDSCLDLINYTSFIVAFMRGEVPGQNPEADIFNRKGQEDQNLIPLAFRTKETPLIIDGVVCAKSK